MNDFTFNLSIACWQILAAMQRELAASGLSPEEILAKTLLLQKAMAGDNSPAFINKTLKNALNVANLNKDDLTKVNKTVNMTPCLEDYKFDSWTEIETFLKQIRWKNIDIFTLAALRWLVGWVTSLKQIGDFPHFWSFVNH